MSNDKSANTHILPGLYLVATPIGNLGDITLRALETLKAADIVVCEDKRVTIKLLNAYGIKKPLYVYNDHSSAFERSKIIDMINGGKIVTLVSDAGTPLISDPGFKLVQQLQEEGLYYSFIPGPSAVMAGMVLSGMETDQFAFLGFWPDKNLKQTKISKDFANLELALVFFESPRRVLETISRMSLLFKNRKIAIARELTKLYEEVIKGDYHEVMLALESKEVIKGEIVIILSKPFTHDEIDYEEELKQLLVTHSVKDAANIIAEKTGMPKKEIYTKALKLNESK